MSGLNIGNYVYQIGMSCIWTPNTIDAGEEECPSVYIYDAGQITGILFPDGMWKCWKSISRRLDGNIATEILEPMPCDWVPLNVISVEEYSLLEYVKTSDTDIMFRIPRWSIQIHLPAIIESPLKCDKPVLISSRKAFGISR